MISFDIVQVDVTDVHGNKTIIYLNRQKRRPRQFWSKKERRRETFSEGKTS